MSTVLFLLFQQKYLKKKKNLRMEVKEKPLVQFLT